jgi:cellulose synthase/poly-beta-1,6-N-acetylglucosamine synthase-like glycosyltransferase
VTILIALILAPLIILTLCFAAELLAGLAPLKASSFHVANAPDAVIVVPAHDEEALIGSTIAGLAAAAGGSARILVVADNCSDATATEARRAGAEVIERGDVERRGKGFALDFARRHLQASPPDLVVIIDADCRIDSASLDRLISACAATGRPCQATYLLDPAPGGSPAVQISNFAFFIRNVVRQRGLQRLVGRVHLLGTGMAMPWSAFDRDELATADIVEDLRMGIELAEAGTPPLFIETAEVWSSPESAGNTLVQRRRWEGGFLAHALASGPKMLAKSIRRADPQRIWAALDLMIPPLALLVMLDLAGLLLGAGLTWMTGASAVPLLLLTGTLLLAVAALAGAWLRGGSRFVTLGGLVRIPLYVAWKLPLYLGLARRGAPEEWLRTRGGGRA